jgi:4-hydroxybenzoate polyprenyltransferase
MFKLLDLAYQLVRTARPRQWLKNFSVFAAPVFSGLFFTSDVLKNIPLCFVVFCMISSAAYFINDIVDAPKDRQHPVKRNRPIASGKLPVWLAVLTSLSLISLSLYMSYFHIGVFVFYAVISYIVLQLSYSAYFRNVIILDSLVVGAGFVIRVFAGGVATNTSLSSWLILATIGLSLLLAFGKRRSEKTLLRAVDVDDGACIVLCVYNHLFSVYVSDFS